MKGEYTPQEAMDVQLAKMKHRDTTDSTERAARIAVETRETAAATLGALNEQGQQMGRINDDLDYVEGDTKEAKSTLRDMVWMRRCCCCLTLFSCCCDCDPHADRDAGRKTRVKARQKERKAIQKERDQNKAAQAEAAARTAEALNGGPPQTETMNRDQLFKERPAAGRPVLQGGPQGGGLNTEDREFVQRNTQRQNDNIGIIGDAAADIKRMAHAMEGEVAAQNPMVDDTVGRVGNAHAGVRESARQTWNYRTGR